MRPGSERQLQLSHNVVCPDLSSSDVTDRSFINLPGRSIFALTYSSRLMKSCASIISNVANGDDRANIDAICNMVSKHIQGNTLILLTITMRGMLRGWLGLCSY